LFKLLDGGDFVGGGGFLFLTNTGELSVHVETIQFLAKAMLPMPDKMHGIADPELRRRYRYIDLIASSLQVEHEGLTTREVFERRARLISGMRNYLDAHGYIEVETPILTTKATGAAAKPFETYHNALDIKLYARIAPELYLKRLEVGGFEKVYELNRNFRNEGLSQRHSPEFTMLEFYCAYMDVNGMMDFAETMIKESVRKATGGSLQVKFGENEIDFSDFARMTMKQAIIKYFPQDLTVSDLEEIDSNWFDDETNIARLSWYLSKIQAQIETEIKAHKESRLEDYRKNPNTMNNFIYKNEADVLDAVDVRGIRSLVIKNHKRELWEKSEHVVLSLKNKGELTSALIGKQIQQMFEEIAELKLIQPTFIVDYPKSISPLSKASPQNPQIAERFELFINGMECANGFSELNDPQEQYERFLDQAGERERGDDEAMVLDEDYIRALSYGMPPAAGIGIGIDRLVMLLTNQHSIRDVILFPHMRPERGTTEESETE
jgi:lysyl-tRNA synthetase class 2